MRAARAGAGLAQRQRTRSAEEPVVQRRRHPDLPSVGDHDGDSIVLFRRADVIAAGDIFDPTEYPIIDLKSGGSFAGVLEGLNRLSRWRFRPTTWKGAR